MTTRFKRAADEVPAAPSFTMIRGRPRLDPPFSAESSGVRRRSEMSPVAAVPGPGPDQRVQYWTFRSVVDAAHDHALRALSVSYDLTVIPHHPTGWERAKTYGHVHSLPGAPGVGCAELYEVLEGHAGFLVEDLRHGPTATLAVLIEAGPGELVVIPPLLHHATINLGSGILVVADVTCRAVVDEYAAIRAARGMAYYIALDGAAVPNEAYRSLPALERTTAQDWAVVADGPLYPALVQRPSALSWVCDPARFAALYPALSHRVGAAT